MNSCTHIRDGALRKGGDDINNAIAAGEEGVPQNHGPMCAIEIISSTLYTMTMPSVFTNRNAILRRPVFVVTLVSHP